MKISRLFSGGTPGSLARLKLILIAIGFIAGIGFLTYLGAGPGSGSRPVANLQGDQQQGQSQQTSRQSAVQGKELLNQFSAAFEDAAAKINPSVVPIFSEQVQQAGSPLADDPFRQFFGDDFFKRFFGGQSQRPQTVRSLGSGVIVSNDGYILTNNHVVEGAQKLTVVLQDNRKFTAKVVGRDPQTDVAVVKIDTKDLPAATLGNSDQVKIGQWVIAVGNPFQLLHTVTAGIISAKGRSSVQLADYEDFFQTDASINPGNSGGALADLNGQIIGINTAILSPSGVGNVGIGFAIPINMAKRVMESLIANGKVTRGYLGLLPQDIDENLAKAMGLPTTQGSLVGDVTPGGPAEKAGIKRGDIITEFNGAKVESSVKLRSTVADAAPGSTAKLTVLRNGKEMTVNVTLGERPAESNAGVEGGREQVEPSSKRLGLTVQALTSALEQQLGFSNERGVVVMDVVPGSPAEEAGIQRGDLIKEVNRTEITSVNDFNRNLAKAKPGDSVAFLIRRGDNTFYAAVRVP